MASILVDQVYALSITEFTRESESNKWSYYVGAGIPLLSAWITSHVVGALMGARIPDSLQLEFVLPLVFVSLLFPALEDRSTKTAAAVSGFVAIAGAGMPLNLGLIIAAGMGVVAGLISETRL